MFVSVCVCAFGHQAGVTTMRSRLNTSTKDRGSGANGNKYPKDINHTNSQTAGDGLDGPTSTSLTGQMIGIKRYDGVA